MAQFMSERITAIVKIRSKERIIQKQLPATKARSGRQTQRRLTNTQFNFRIVENINIRPYALGDSRKSKSIMESSVATTERK